MRNLQWEGILTFGKLGDCQARHMVRGGIWRYKHRSVGFVMAFVPSHPLRTCPRIHTGTSHRSESVGKNSELKIAHRGRLHLRLLVIHL